ncbi:hypothetical protein, partial [Sporisorium scitamineum]
MAVAAHDADDANDTHDSSHAKAAQTEEETVPAIPTSATEVAAQEQSARGTASSTASSSESIPESLSDDESETADDVEEIGLAQDQPQPLQLRTRVRARQQGTIAPTQVVEQDPFADSNQIVSAAPEAASNSFASPEDDIQPINDMDKDRDIEKQSMDAHARGGKAAFDESLFPDYAPLVQSRVTVGRHGLILAIGALNLGLVILF